MLGVPGWFLFFFWGGGAAWTVDDVGAVLECCCFIWFWSSSRIFAKKGTDEEEAAIFDSFKFFFCYHFLAATSFSSSLSNLNFVKPKSHMQFESFLRNLISKTSNMRFSTIGYWLERNLEKIPYKGKQRWRERKGNQPPWPLGASPLFLFLSLF